jgi:phenylalanyl-tRNA synthetase beta chain
MNILVSDKWLRGYVKMRQKPEAFAAAISLVGPAVERIHRQGADLDRIVVGRIVSLKAHPNADKLHLVSVDVGAKKLNIVCGGSNLAPDMLVAVALIGSRVRWHGQGELVALEPVTIRGVASEGMICAADEIGLGDRFPAKSEKEIVDLSPLNLKVGAPLKEALDLDDVIYDIEVTTNRPDALGVVGLAREAAAATGGEFLWKDAALRKLKVNSSKLKVAIQAKKLCSRYAGALIEGVKVGPSPDWMRQRLASAGLRPINAAVDITNYVMLELGQPMHAFDADKIEKRSIVVRQAKAGEKIVGLDSQTYQLAEGMLVIADPLKPLAVAGVIGGEESKVTEATTSIILEAASFDGNSIRRTGRDLNLRTDAVMRFEKHVPQGLSGPALARAIELTLEICGGTLVAVEDCLAEKENLSVVSITVAQLNAKVGVQISTAEIKRHLAALGFKVVVSGGKIKAKVPYWRAGDVSIPEDLVEEVARLHGYHNLPLALPPNLTGEAPDPAFVVEEKIRQALGAAGANELISISLVGPELLKRSGESGTPTVKIANPLSSDMDSLRPSHRARLLDAVCSNEKNFSSGAVFEIGKIFTPPADADGLPIETMNLGLVCWGKNNAESGARFYEAKGLLERVFTALHLKLALGKDFPKNDFWHHGRTASIHLGSAVIGTVGELSPDATKAAGVESRASLALVDIAELVKAARVSASYAQLPEYPAVRRDVAFIVDRKTENDFVIAAIEAVDPLIESAEFIERYEGEKIAPGKKSLAYRVVYRSKERTLMAAEAEAAHDKVVKMLEHKFKATVRS